MNATAYKIESIKITESLSGTIEGAIARAKEIDAEYQPAWGVQVYDDDGLCLWDSVGVLTE